MKSQLSVEYLILTGFVLVAVVIPISLWAYTAATGSMREEVSAGQAAELGNGLIDDAKQVYYLGIYSKKLVVYQLPSNLERMFVLDLLDTNAEPDRHHYYIGVVLGGKEPQRILFESEIPLTSDSLNPYVSMAGDQSVVGECLMTGFSCDFYDFTGDVIKTGKKEFKLETIPSGTTAIVSITPR